jgi:hypothetical protein
MSASRSEGIKCVPSDLEATPKRVKTRIMTLLVYDLSTILEKWENRSVTRGV